MTSTMTLWHITLKCENNNSLTLSVMLIKLWQYCVLVCSFFVPSSFGWVFFIQRKLLCRSTFWRNCNFAFELITFRNYPVLLFNMGSNVYMVYAIGSDETVARKGKKYRQNWKKKRNKTNLKCRSVCVCACWYRTCSRDIWFSYFIPSFKCDKGNKTVGIFYSNKCDKMVLCIYVFSFPFPLILTPK